MKEKTIEDYLFITFYEFVAIKNVSWKEINNLLAPEEDYPNIFDAWKNSTPENKKQIITLIKEFIDNL